MASTSNRIPAIDQAFRAFADRTRLRMLCLLRRNECCVGDLVEVLRIEQPSASRHLAYLRKAGLVKVRKSGQWSYYSLTAAEQPFHEKLLECLSCCFDDMPQVKADRLRHEKIKKRGGCCPSRSD